MKKELLYFRNTMYNFLSTLNLEIIPRKLYEDMPEDDYYELVVDSCDDFVSYVDEYSGEVVEGYLLGCENGLFIFQDKDCVYSPVEIRLEDLTLDCMYNLCMAFGE